MINEEEYNLRLRGFEMVRDILIRESETNPQLNSLYTEWSKVLRESMETKGREEFHWHSDIDQNNTEGLSQLEYFYQNGYGNEIEIRGTLLMLQFLMEWKRGNYTKVKEIYKGVVILPPNPL
jgi:hypothetical protein